jgi:hypothetical protein
MPRELAQRTAGHVEITLYWDAGGDEVMVELIDRGGGASFQIFVEPDRALDAFHHPYAYASSLELPPEPEPHFAIRVD